MREVLAHIPRMTNYDESVDDHAFLRNYRDMAAIAISPAGFPIALRHSAIGPLTDPSTTRQLETESIRKQGITAGPIFELFSRSMLFSNGDLHKKRRGPVSRTFAFKLMEGMRGEVSRLAGDIVTAAKGQDELDFLDAFAGEIPARVIAQILGLPESEMPRFRKLVYSVTRAFKVGFDQSQQAEIERDFGVLIAEVDRLLDQSKGQPRDDFLSRLVVDAEERFELSLDDIRWQVVTLIIGGSDTTRLALCSTLALLLSHPEQWQAFCQDPEGLKKQVVQEGLRFEPPIASFARVALEEIELDGFGLPAGSPVSVCLLSAMRDERLYADPFKFDIFRVDHPRWHPAFGTGQHRCLGEALARAELEECLAAIARLAPDTKLLRAPVIRGLNGIRRIDQMRVAIN
jgi:cytochrome P450 family 103